MGNWDCSPSGVPVLEEAVVETACGFPLIWQLVACFCLFLPISYST